MEESTLKRYGKADLEEFEAIINQKLKIAKSELLDLEGNLSNSNNNGTDDTASSYNTMQDGTSTFAKERTSQMVTRLKKFIINLENALIRIKNGTYGVCRVTGKLISKERLKSVPHTTQSIIAKRQQYK